MTAKRNSFRPPKVAVVDAGSAGTHAATQQLIGKAAQAVRADLFDRLPYPYGLVRSDDASDHQKITSVTRNYETHVMSVSRASLAQTTCERQAPPR